MNRMFGAPSGAFFGVNGPQSAFESRTSSLMVPLKSLYGPTGSVPAFSWARSGPNGMTVAIDNNAAPTCMLRRVFLPGFFMSGSFMSGLFMFFFLVSCGSIASHA
jgi:hypothetical protein